LGAKMKMEVTQYRKLSAVYSGTSHNNKHDLYTRRTIENISKHNKLC
jgi:hypothetical protein